MHVRPATADDHDALVALVADCQRDPARHMTYVDTAPEAIAEYLARLARPWTDVAVVAETTAGVLAGALVGDHDTDPPRVWWLGPWVATTVHRSGALAEALLLAGRERLPAHVTEEECGPDARNTTLARAAAALGFRADPASACLRVDTAALAAGDPPDGTEIGVEVGVAGPGDVAAVVALHDAAFARTHTPGHRLVSAEGTRVLVARDAEGALLGYVATELDEVGDCYVDYLAVDPDARRRGVGRALVAAAVTERRDRDGCTSAHLSVRVGNAGARRLYASLGFEQEHVAVPWRRGFHEDPGTG
jgi:ribosomal protein S18 acetylase RimI-like enzyme